MPNRLENIIFLQIFIHRRQFILDEDIDNSQDSDAVDDEMQSQRKLEHKQHHRYLTCSGPFVQQIIWKEMDFSCKLVMRNAYYTTVTYSCRTHSPPPCKHTGPCGRHAGCSCWNEGVYCQRTCSCSKHCEFKSHLRPLVNTYRFRV